MSPQPHITARAPARSMGLKLLLVCALALLMSIPALFVFALLNDRTHRAEQVAQEVGAMTGGQQVFAGPILAIPWTGPGENGTEARGAWAVFPTTGETVIDTRSELRRRGLFGVPVYKADFTFKAHFDLTKIAPNLPPNLPKGAVLDPTRAELLVGVTDARGAQADITLNVAGQPVTLAPASVYSSLTLNRGDKATGSSDLTLFGAPAGGLTGAFDVSGRARFSGATRVSALPFANITDIVLKGDWKSPSFDGGFAPLRRSLSDKGFEAAWTIPFIARGVPAQGGIEEVSRLGDKEAGVRFVEPANPYQSVARSLKYALMFVGLVFLAYFIFETITGKRVHPAQYVLIGLAQIVFYLLLLSVAERTGFDIAFVIAAGATVALISAYAGWVFDSRRQGLIALIAFSALYALIYVLMRLEDFALLVGALTSFAAIAAVMYFTRRIDWYGVRPAPAAAPSSTSTPSKDLT